MTKDVKISIAIEIGNSQKIRAEFEIHPDYIWQWMSEIQRQLDPFHINKAVREAYGKDINVSDTLKTLYQDGFDAVAKELQRLKDKGSSHARKAKNSCFEYLKSH